MRDQLENKLNEEICDLKEEILIAKRILKDPNLSNLATRKFAETINKFEENKFFAESAAVTDILE